MCFRPPGTISGIFLASAWKSAGLIFGMPTYEYKIFPPMSHVIDELLLKKVTNKKVFRYGSYGWVGGAQRDFEAKIEKSGWDMQGHYEWQGAPTEADEQNMVQALEAFCQELIRVHPRIRNNGTQKMKDEILGQFTAFLDAYRSGENTGADHLSPDRLRQAFDFTLSETGKGPGAIREILEAAARYTPDVQAPDLSGLFLLSPGSRGAGRGFSDLPSQHQCPCL